MKKIICIFAVGISLVPQVLHGEIKSGTKPKIIISGEISDKKSGKPIADAYIGCVGLFEVKRSTPFLLANDVVKENHKGEFHYKVESVRGAPTAKFVKAQIQKVRHEQPKENIDATDWSIFDIAEHVTYPVPFWEEPLFTKWSSDQRIFALSLPLAANAKSGPSGRFVITDLYAPTQDIFGGYVGMFKQSIERYYSKTLSEMLNDKQVVKLIGVVFYIFRPGYMPEVYGVYHDEATNKKRWVRAPAPVKVGTYVVTGDELIKSGREYKVLPFNPRGGSREDYLWEVEEKKGYANLFESVPGPRGLNEYKTFASDMPEQITLKTALSPVDDKTAQQYDKELWDILFGKGAANIMWLGYGPATSQTPVKMRDELSEVILKEIAGIKGSEWKNSDESLWFKESFGTPRPAPPLMNDVKEYINPDADGNQRYGIVAYVDKDRDIKHYEADKKLAGCYRAKRVDFVGRNTGIIKSIEGEGVGIFDGRLQKIRRGIYVSQNSKNVLYIEHPILADDQDVKTGVPYAEKKLVYLNSKGDILWEKRFKRYERGTAEREIHNVKFAPYFKAHHLLYADIYETYSQIFFSDDNKVIMAKSYWYTLYPEGDEFPTVIEVYDKDGLIVRFDPASLTGVSNDGVYIKNISRNGRYVVCEAYKSAMEKHYYTERTLVFFDVVTKKAWNANRWCGLTYINNDGTARIYSKGESWDIDLKKYLGQ